MGTLIHVQLYTFSYRKAVIRPQNMPKTSDWGVCGAKGFPNGRPEIKQCKIGS